MKLLSSLVLLVVGGTPPLWGHLTPGARAVGFTVLNARDSARRDSSGAARPIQISVWYPARAPRSARRLVYGDYVALAACELGGECSAAPYRKFLVDNGVSPGAVATWMSSPMAAVRDAAHAPGSFPLVVIAQGNGNSAHDQAILAEYLASHGYIVATTPSQALIPDKSNSGDAVLPKVEAQAVDISLALLAVRMAFAVRGRAGLIGHSFGARSALLVASRDPSIGALVSLDGGIGNKLGKEWIDGARGFDSTTFWAPVLHFYEEIDSRIIVPDFALLRSLHRAPVTLVRVDSLHHIHFTSLGMASAVIPKFVAGPPSPSVGEKYEGVARVSLAFLDAALAGRKPVVRSESRFLGIETIPR
ncbi:MAG: hypothetical protein M3081_06640 [Gemmatimonadota bacterium]|nr:hypothetical protein [Gemmatimonadota bacterium]